MKLRPLEFKCLPEYQDKIRWFEDSPDAGLPECICSLCGEVIGTPWWENSGAEDKGDFPIRAFDTERNLEARFHIDCFSKVTGLGIG